MSGPRRGFGPACGLLIPLAVLFSDAWLGGHVFYQRDLLGYWYPYVAVFRRLVAEGSLPWWNPFIAFGAPLFADPSFQLAYPPTWLALAMPAAAYFKLFVFGHCWLAAVATRGLVARLGGSAAAAMLAAVAYSCSGPLLSSVSLYHHFAGAAWMPAVLWAFVAAVQSATTAAFLRLGAVAAAQALAGSADLCVMTALAGLVLLGHALPRRGVRWNVLLRLLALSVVFAASLAAIQWLPALALAADSARPSLTPATNLYWSTHPARLIEWLVPRLLPDLPLSAVAREALFESRGALFASLYLGVPALTLAALGSVGRAGWGRWLGLGFAFFTILSLGRHAALLPLLLKVPPFGLFRYPEKYALPASLLFAILVARGCDAWLQGWDVEARRRGMSVALGALALALCIFVLAAWAAGEPPPVARLFDPTATAEGRGAVGHAVQRLRLSGLAFLLSGALLLARGLAGSAKPTATALGLALVADLVAAGRGVNPLAPASVLEYRPPVLSKLGGPSRFRVLSYAEPLAWLNQQFKARFREGDPEVAWALASAERLEPPGASRFGIRGSYDGDFSGLAQPGLYALGVILRRFEATALGPRLLQMGNVGYVVGLREAAFGLRPQATFPTLLGVPLRVFPVPDPLPAAYLVDGIQVAQEPRSFELMAAVGFDPGREAIVASGAEARTPGAGFRGTVRMASYRADRAVMEAELSGPGLLVLVEAWRRGWSVEVDGKPAPLLRANVLFRAVALQAGRHTVVFSYRPPLLPAGGCLSLGAVLFGAVAAFRARSATRGVEGGEPVALASAQHRGEAG